MVNTPDSMDCMAPNSTHHTRVDMAHKNRIVYMVHRNCMACMVHTDCMDCMDCTDHMDCTEHTDCMDNMHCTQRTDHTDSNQHRLYCTYLGYIELHELYMGVQKYNQNNNTTIERKFISSQLTTLCDTNLSLSNRIRFLAHCYVIEFTTEFRWATSGIRFLETLWPSLTFCSGTIVLQSITFCAFTFAVQYTATQFTTFASFRRRTTIGYLFVLRWKFRIIIFFCVTSWITEIVRIGPENVFRVESDENLINAFHYNVAIVIFR